MPRAVITGSTGMIGRHLAADLIASGYEVVALAHANSLHGAAHKPQGVDEGTIPTLLCDMQEYAIWANQPQAQRPQALQRPADVFFHLGWAGTTGNGRDDCSLQLQNIQGTLGAVELAAALGCSVFVGVGSQAEYGRSNKALSPCSPTNPETGYGVAKLAAGQLSRLRCSQLGMRHTWVRIFSVYGPGDAKNNMVTATCRELLEGRTPQLTPGEQQWDYLYVADAARALRLVAEQGKDGAIYCLGSGQTKPLRHYVEIMRDCIDPSAELNFCALPYKAQQVMHLQADTASLKADTGFEPAVSFEEGILATVAWLKDEKKA